MSDDFLIVGGALYAALVFGALLKFISRGVSGYFLAVPVVMPAIAAALCPLFFFVILFAKGVKGKDGPLTGFDRPLLAIKAFFLPSVEYPILVEHFTDEIWPDVRDSPAPAPSARFFDWLSVQATAILLSFKLVCL